MAKKVEEVPVVEVLAIIPPPVDQIPVSVIEEKPGYTIEACQDCGKRRKLYKDAVCSDCWLTLEEKREKIRKKCAKGKGKD